MILQHNLIILHFLIYQHIHLLLIQAFYLMMEQAEYIMVHQTLLLCIQVLQQPRLAATRTKDEGVALELTAGKCGAATKPGTAGPAWGLTGPPTKGKEAASPSVKTQD